MYSFDVGNNNILMFETIKHLMTWKYLVLHLKVL